MVKGKKEAFEEGFKAGPRELSDPPAFSGSMQGTELADRCRGGPNRLWCLSAWPIGSDTIRRCGLVGGSVSL